MIRKASILILILVCFFGCKKDKSPVDTTIHNELISGGGTLSFQRIIGGDKLDNLYSVKQTIDGGYIFCGFTENEGASERDVLLVRTNSTGETIWIKRFSDNFTDQGWSLDLTLDNGFIIAATSSLTTGNGYNSSYKYSGQLIKTDSNGNLQWKKSFTFGNYTDFSSVKSTNDGGYIVCGTENNSKVGILLKTDGSGNEVWRKSFGSNTQFSHLYYTMDDGAIICGSIKSDASALSDIYIIRTNSSGDTIWAKTYGDSLENYGRSIVELTSGNFVVCGFNSNPTSGFSKLINAIGEEIWHKDFANIGIQLSESIQLTSDNAFILIGYTWTSLSTSNAYLFKIDSNGNNVWQKTFKPREFTTFQEVQLTSDNGFVIAGYTKSGSDGNALIVKTDSNGN